MGMAKFHDRILDRMTGTTASEVVGPGRMARCERVSVQVKFGTGTTGGTVEVQWSHHQSFPGSPAVLASIAWSSEETGDAITIEPRYFNGFIRVKPTVASSVGEGVSAWASGN